MLKEAGVPMEKKNFAIGVRIEHDQQAVSRQQYGPAFSKLPPSDYKLGLATCPAAGRLSPSVSAPVGRWWRPPPGREAWSLMV